MKPQSTPWALLIMLLPLALSNCGKWNTNNPTIPVGPTLTVGAVFTLPGEVQAMVARDNRLFVCISPPSPDSATKLFYVVDASNPMNPQVVGSAMEHGQYGWVYGLALYGSYAYVNTYNEGLTVLDISNPTAPQVLASCDTLAAIPAGIAGSHLYAIGYGLDYISLADPVHPRREGRANIYNEPRLVAPWDETRCVVFDNQVKQLFIVDFSAPGSPRRVAYSHPFPGRTVSVCSGSIFVATGFSSLAVLKFNWSGNDSITQEGKTDLPAPSSFLIPVGNRLAVGTALAPYNESLFLLSSSGSQSPYVVGECELPYAPVHLAADGNRIYVDFGKYYMGEGYMTTIEVTEH